jgi:hypothetical protein
MDGEEIFFFIIFVYVNIDLMSCWKKIKVEVTKEDTVFKEPITPNSRTNSTNFSLSMMDVHLGMYGND